MFLTVAFFPMLDGAGIVIVLCSAMLVGAKLCECLGCCTSAVEVFILMGCGTAYLDISNFEFETVVLSGNAGTSHPMMWHQIPEE
jgi:hypothetical protein